MLQDARDIFSAGVILFVLLTARYPFNQALKNDKKYSLLIDGKSQQFWKIHCDDKYKSIINNKYARDLIEKMLCYNPDNAKTPSHLVSIMTPMYENAMKNKENEGKLKKKTEKLEDWQEMFEVVLFVTTSIIPTLC